MTLLEKQFERLGDDGGVGMAFAISRVALGEDYAGNLENLPRPAYDHGIWLDPGTGNYIVLRAETDGGFHPIVEKWRRLR